MLCSPFSSSEHVPHDPVHTACKCESSRVRAAFALASMYCMSSCLACSLLALCMLRPRMPPFACCTYMSVFLTRGHACRPACLPSASPPPLRPAWLQFAARTPSLVATCLKLRRLHRQPLSGLIAFLQDYCGRGKGDVLPCQILRRAVSGPRRAALGGLALPGSLGGVLLPPGGASDISGGLDAPCPAPLGFVHPRSGVTPVVCLALPCYAPPPPWSVGSAPRWLGGARSSPKGPLWPKALPPEPSSLAGWYGVACVRGSMPVDASSTHIGKQEEEEEEECITGGNWRGKHNSLRGAAADLP